MYDRFDSQYRAQPRPPEELAARHLGGASGKATLIAELPGLLQDLAEEIEGWQSNPPTAQEAAIAVTDARALAFCVERVHSIVTRTGA